MITIVHRGEITTESSKLLVEKVLFASSPFILFLESPGGNVAEAQRFILALQLINAAECAVYSSYVVESAAVLWFLALPNRYIGENFCLVFHRPIANTETGQQKCTELFLNNFKELLPEKHYLWACDAFLNERCVEATELQELGIAEILRI